MDRTVPSGDLLIFPEDRSMIKYPESVNVIKFGKIHLYIYD